MNEENTPFEEPQAEEAITKRCENCGGEFSPKFSRDGTYCFQCSVHEACACADDPE